MTKEELIALIEAKIQDQKPYLEKYPNPPTRSLTSEGFVSQLIDVLNPVLSRYNPRKIRTTFAGADTKIYDLSSVLAADTWVQDFSRIVEVWFPYDVTNEVQDPIPQAYWELEKRNFGGDTLDALVFQIDTPAAAQEIEILYKTIHVFLVAPDNISVAAQDVNAFADFVAGHYILGVSSEFLQHVSSYITADVVSNLNPTSDAQAVGLQFIKNFYNHFGASIDDQEGNVSEWVDWGGSGDNTFFHRKPKS